MDFEFLEPCRQKKIESSVFKIQIKEDNRNDRSFFLKVYNKDFNAKSTEKVPSIKFECGTSSTYFVLTHLLQM